MVEIETREPVVEDGIKYWEEQPATYDGVLGGFGSGSLPRIESLGSRQFLMHVCPDLCTVPSALRPLSPPPPPKYRIRALDVGAGIGRVTADTLLHLVQDVVLVEPVEKLVRSALERAPSWKGIADRSKSITVLQGTLQDLDPLRLYETTKHVGHAGFVHDCDSDGGSNTGFDVVWCQWCLMYMSDRDLVAFFRRCRESLRDERSIIVVKENTGANGKGPDGEPTPLVYFDEDDSSVARSDLAWKALFEEAGLTLVHEQIQHGLPPGLYAVHMYALR
ncbi:DUF858-domain-containing protein [Vararia minispora EC-137]|uniref:DUF858-domain-containing protein n=1 Tax=Vararia minispora EC-137 TaxID=1314806 RepID=A0ACB8QTT9_9AGAM|nr:DUF858-domain-containing protein [Vararia minispora EC-137]